jgi:hypothetical protein
MTLADESPRLQRKKQFNCAAANRAGAEPAPEVRLGSVLLLRTPGVCQAELGSHGRTDGPRWSTWDGWGLRAHCPAKARHQRAHCACNPRVNKALELGALWNLDRFSMGRGALCLFRAGWEASLYAAEWVPASPCTLGERCAKVRSPTVSEHSDFKYSRALVTGRN